MHHPFSASLRKNPNCAWADEGFADPPIPHRFAGIRDPVYALYVDRVNVKLPHAVHSHKRILLMLIFGSAVARPLKQIVDFDIKLPRVLGRLATAERPLDGIACGRGQSAVFRRSQTRKWDPPSDSPRSTTMGSGIKNPTCFQCVDWPLGPVVKLTSESIGSTAFSNSLSSYWLMSTGREVGRPSRVKKVSKWVRNALIVLLSVMLRVKGVLKSRLRTVAVCASTSCRLSPMSKCMCKYKGVSTHLDDALVCNDLLGIHHIDETFAKVCLVHRRHVESCQSVAVLAA